MPREQIDPLALEPFQKVFKEQMSKVPDEKSEDKDSNKEENVVELDKIKIVEKVLKDIDQRDIEGVKSNLENLENLGVLTNEEVKQFKYGLEFGVFKKDKTDKNIMIYKGSKDDILDELYKKLHIHITEGEKEKVIKDKSVDISELEIESTSSSEKETHLEAEINIDNLLDKLSNYTKTVNKLEGDIKLKANILLNQCFDLIKDFNKADLKQDKYELEEFCTILDQKLFELEYFLEKTKTSSKSSNNEEEREVSPLEKRQEQLLILKKSKKIIEFDEAYESYLKMLQKQNPDIITDLILNRLLVYRDQVLKGKKKIPKKVRNELFDVLGKWSRKVDEFKGVLNEDYKEAQEIHSQFISELKQLHNNYRTYFTKAERLKNIKYADIKLNEFEKNVINLNEFRQTINNRLNEVKSNTVTRKFGRKKRDKNR